MLGYYGASIKTGCQYGVGEHQSGYLEEVSGNLHSHTETFLALKAKIANWR